MTSYLRGRWSDAYKIRFADAKRDADEKLKPEVEIRYGGRSFSETRGSYNSAVDRGVVTKFGTRGDPAF